MLKLITIYLFVLTSSCAYADKPFYFGADLSYVNEMEACGARYAVDAEIRDPYQIFAEAGSNLVRLRLWHNPDWTAYSNLNDVKKSLRRAKGAGMQTLLDFQYSDDWADPAKQIIPQAWAHITDTHELAEKLYQYTYDTLLSLHTDNLMPDLIQIGNEINSEIMLLDEVGENATTPINWERNVYLLNAGILAVRDIAEITHTSPRVMIHIAQPENSEPWFTQATQAGLLDFDIIGLSYYSKWSNQSLLGLSQTINRLRQRYQVDVIVVETAYPWTLKNKPGDTADNLLGADSLAKGYSATPAGQFSYLTDLTQAIINGGGQGIVYWEPAWVSSQCETRWGKGSHWENATLFNLNDISATLPGIGFYSAQYNYPVPVEFNFYFHNPEQTSTEIFLWGDFLGSNEYAVRLLPQGGKIYYQTSLMPGTIVQYQLLDSSSPKNKLIKNTELNKDGFASFIVGTTGSSISHKIQ